MGDTQEAEVQYVNYRYERAQQEDGRRCHRWFLVDQLGTEHPAVVGIETDTMDGHYNYFALEPFSSHMPLTCGNQAGVTKYLREWLGQTNDADDLPTYSGGASSAATGGGGNGRRKAFASSLCSSRAAILNAAGASPVHFHSGSSGRGKKKGGGNQTAIAAYSTGPGGKHKAVGIVQQNQLKKARKYQEDIRAEHERLVAGHLSRLRRAAAAELQADSAAKQITMSWLQGALTEEEQGHLSHWQTLLTAVLDLQDQQEAAGSGSSQPPLRKQKGAAGSSAAAAAKAAVAALPDKLAEWLQQPSSKQHYLRVILECLRELEAAEIPARVLLQLKLIALVQRCRSECQHEAVRALADMVLARWKWQLAGHMQVLRDPVYMEDHAGVLEEEVNAGLVPLPTLPKYKQAVLNTQLPILPGGPGSRSAYTPAHSGHMAQHLYQHHYQQTASSTPQLFDASTATSFQGAGYAGDGSVVGSDAAAAAGFAAGFFTPMPSLAAVQVAASPMHGQQQQQHLMLYGPGSVPGQVAQFLPGQEMLTTDAAAAAGGMPQGWQVLAAGAAAVPGGGMEAAQGAPATAAGDGAVLGQQPAGSMSVRQ